LAKLESLIESAAWCATPFGENETDGSVARWKSPPFAALPPVQRLNLACPVSGAELIGGMVQLALKFASTQGSTSAFGYTVPVCGAPSQPAANGLRPLTTVNGSTAAAAGAVATIAATAASTSP